MSYHADGRASIAELQARYGRLESQSRFHRQPVYAINLAPGVAPAAMSVDAYLAGLAGPALWVLAGVHGEEPAGPNAIAQEIDSLGSLGREIPLVVLPLLNPYGYYRDWRYPDEPRDWRLGHSVSDSEHYLPDTLDANRARVSFPRSAIAARVTQFVLHAITAYPPVLTIDHHEDEQLESSYVYSQGRLGATDAVAQAIVRILADSGLPTQMDGHTRFGELIQNGVVVDAHGQPVKDGSIDELLAAEHIIIAGQPARKWGARTSVVIETPAGHIPLARRVAAHANILRQLRRLWTVAGQIA